MSVYMEGGLKKEKQRRHIVFAFGIILVPEKELNQKLSFYGFPFSESQNSKFQQWRHIHLRLLLEFLYSFRFYFAFPLLKISAAALHEPSLYFLGLYEIPGNFERHIVPRVNAEEFSRGVWLTIWNMKNVAPLNYEKYLTLSCLY